MAAETEQKTSLESHPQRFVRGEAAMLWKSDPVRVRTARFWKCQLRSAGREKFGVGGANNSGQGIQCSVTDLHPAFQLYCLNEFAILPFANSGFNTSAPFPVWWSDSLKEGATKSQLDLVP